jgi:hypothetical protein
MTGDFHGLPSRVISNKYLRLEFLAQSGPRIVRLSFAGSNLNLLAETPHKRMETPYGDYFFHGGHRLWYAPETFPHTYLPDNAGLTIEELDDGICLRQLPESITGIAKSIEIHLAQDRPALTLLHRLQNDGAQGVECAPWAITQVPLGGVAILPQQVDAIDEQGLLPNRNLVLWPYTRWDDARLELGDDFIRVHARQKTPPCKIGYLNRRGWVGYWNADVLLVKRFDPQPNMAHPDFGCNVEVYCSDEHLELETLAPLCRLEPGRSVTHVETWELYSGLETIQTQDNVKSMLSQLSL